MDWVFVNVPMLSLMGNSCHHFPEVANNYPKPDFGSTNSFLATFSYQATTPALAPPPMSWTCPTDPVPIPSQIVPDDPSTFFRTQPCTDACTFCNQPGHHVRNCEIAKGYIHTNRAIVVNGRICLPNGEQITDVNTSESANDSGSDSDDDLPDIFKVFANEKKKRSKPSKLPEAKPPKQDKPPP
ncbi:hypothetical protein F5148DRAFT_1151185 [Russula earlei]|uniref:Uncharacterized protein n=1 Tax=Russula earlei TaxID=71964 RepID=A0ACC0U136_9AGAM|nr:hypothetical protein F5148DRAFT_1151185 [Russula earlei]